MEVVEKEKAEQQDKKAVEEQKAKDAAYWQQQAQQYDANARREREAREQNEKAAAEAKTQLSQTTQKLQELETKLQQQSQYQKMDKDVVDPAVASNIEALQKQIEALTGTLNAQQNKITQYEQLEQKREADRRYTEVVEAICKPLDDKYGQKFRSQARELADKAVDEGRERKPTNALEAYLIHEKFYIELSEKAKNESKSTATDSGKGSKSTKATKPKQGTLKEVLAEMKSKAKN
jgi:flagellar biosynthesis chaperone FliJ